MLGQEIPVSVRPLVQFSWVLVFAAMSGCGGGNELPLHPVSGKLLVDGKPAEGAVLVFHATSPQELQANKPAARVQGDGSFEVTTIEAGDGALAGEYVVTVSWGGPGLPDRLGGKFRNPERSELKVTVTEGENALEPFELSAVSQATGRGRRNDSRPVAER